jgi:diphosphomevalonate decarboxylase
LCSNDVFAQKVSKYLDSILDIYPFLSQLHLKIESSNSFPHSTGIASSASSMSALALCLTSLEHKLFNSLPEDSEFERKASFLARLASGSACRSIYSYCAEWGKITDIPDSSDEYAVYISEIIHPVFKSYRDSILIVSSEKKKISSRAGHELMNTHAFASARFLSAKQNANSCLQIMRLGELDLFNELVEREALTLHGLMMSSSPSFTLIHPNTLKILNIVRDFRNDTKIPVCFTLDAGPNVHLLYPEAHKEAVISLINGDLKKFCEEERWIDDFVGEGPIQKD